ncbi:hypothetical protein SDC9_166348 [bioreactor metagenome]|uniref:Uncharacterized protein n=1 Tax=bioreactor metagenome TaxID=1076179 RepID=A0A645FZ52_9ZZZZ
MDFRFDDPAVGFDDFQQQQIRLLIEFIEMKIQRPVFIAPLFGHDQIIEIIDFRIGGIALIGHFFVIGEQNRLGVGKLFQVHRGTRRHDRIAVEQRPRRHRGIHPAAQQQQQHSDPKPAISAHKTPRRSIAKLSLWKFTAEIMKNKVFSGETCHFYLKNSLPELH